MALFQKELIIEKRKKKRKKIAVWDDKRSAVFKKIKLHRSQHHQLIDPNVFQHLKLAQNANPQGPLVLFNNAKFQ